MAHRPVTAAGVLPAAAAGRKSWASLVPWPRWPRPPSSPDVGVAAPAGAASPYDPKPVKAGAGWLSDQVTDGLVHNDQYDFDDVGLSIDVALGLDAAGKKPTVVKTITKAVAKNVASYTSFAPSVYAGPTAKAAVLALSQDKNPRAFGGVDLIKQLEDRVATAAPITGRIEDAYDPSDQFGGDFANVIGQSYAAQALSEAGSPEAGAVTAFLLQQQCDKGYFRQYFTADKTRPDQSCEGAPRAEGHASTDATALAVLALQDVKGKAAKVAVDNAVDWLVFHQQDSGGFSANGKHGLVNVNANSTGLAGWAFGVAGAATYAAKAAVVVRGLQVEGATPCTGKLGKDAGAIAFDAGAYGAGLDEGHHQEDQRPVAAGVRPGAAGPPVGAARRGQPRRHGSRPGAGGVDVHHPASRARPRASTPASSSAASSPSTCPGRHALTRLTLDAPSSPGVRTYAVWVGGVRRDVVVRVTG